MPITPNTKTNRKSDAMSDHIRQISDAIRLSAAETANELRRSADKVEEEAEKFCAHAAQLSDMLNEGFNVAEDFTDRLTKFSAGGALRSLVNVHREAVHHEELIGGYATSKD
jgi:hypothetical protein